MAKDKTKAELRAENRVLRRFRTSEGIATVVNNLVRWGGAVLIARYGYLSIEALSGERTLADIGVNVLTDLRVSQAMAWIFGGSGFAYGFAQRKVRKDTIERLQGRIRQFEREIDPGRTSSRLTPRGDTRPEDQQ